MKWKNKIKKIFVISSVLILSSCLSTEAKSTEQATSSFKKSNVKFYFQNSNATNNNLLFNEGEYQTLAKLRMELNSNYKSDTFNLTLFRNGTKIMSEVLYLEEGQYEITKFEILNNSDSIVYYTPETENEIVKNLDIETSLPYNINIVKYSDGKFTQEICMEVVATDNDDDLSDFGYEPITVEEVKYNSFLVSTFCFSFFDEHELTNADIQIKYKSLENPNQTKKSTIKVNKEIRIDVGLSDEYELICKKNGYFPERYILSSDDLKKYKEKPLTIELEKIISADYFLEEGFVGGQRRLYWWDVLLANESVEWKMYFIGKLETKFATEEQIKEEFSANSLKLNINNLVSNLVGVKYFTKLTELVCNNQNLTTLRGIEGLTDLISLDCSFNKLENLDGLELLTKLKTLNCSSNPDLEINGTFNSVQKLNCQNIFQQDLTKIANFSNLDSLNCSGNDLVSLEGVKNLTKLKKLDCSFNRLTSLEGIEKLSNLEELQCYMNNISSLQILENLKNLKVLYCDEELGTREREYLKEIFGDDLVVHCVGKKSK